MKKNDEKLWLETVRVYEKQNPERGPEIIKFVEKLADVVEERLEDLDGFTSTEFRALVEFATREIDPDHLIFAELVEAHVVLSQTWRYGEQLLESMMYMERQAIIENFVRKVQVQQQEAEEEGPKSTSTPT